MTAQHWTARPMTVADGATVADLLNEQHQMLIGRDVADADDITTWLSMPNGDLGRDSRILLDDERAVASLIVEGRTRSNLVKVFVSLGRTKQRPAVADRLLTLVAAHARVSADAAGLVDPVIEVEEVPSGDTDLEAELTDRGYAPVRRSVELSLTLTPDLPSPSLPSGIALVTVDLTDPIHLEALAQIEAEAFEDHDGDLVLQRDELVHVLTTDPKYLTDLQLLAVDTTAGPLPGAAVAMSLAASMSTEDAPTGYVMSLGVRRSWRGQGIGRALLLTQFHAFVRHGWQVAKLHVQVDNRTGADRLYTSLGMEPVSGFAVWAGRLPAP